MPERRKPRWLHFSGPKRPIFRIKADIFRSNSPKLLSGAALAGKFRSKAARDSGFCAVRQLGQRMPDKHNYQAYSGTNRLTTRFDQLPQSP